MNKKNILAVACLSATAITAMTGCKKVTAGGESTIQIRVYSGGYGTAWLHEITDKFEDAFPQYKVQYVEESGLVSQTAENEMLTPNKNQIDLYFTNGTHVSNLISKSRGILRTNNQTLLEPLDDVFESKAIGYDGKEESKTIKERFFDGYDEAFTYNGSVEKWHGNKYSLPWADATTGLFVNKSVLDKYGLDMPLTTDEFINTVEVISSHTAADKVYPMSMAGNNAPGYMLYLYEIWFAQYSGKEGYDNFIKCDPGNGNIEKEGYKVYEDKGILETLKVFEQFCKLDYFPNGSVDKPHTDAQNELINGKTAYMVDGEWMLHEMISEYPEVKDIVMLSAPILSCIGKEAGITDAQLHDVVAAIDEGKNNDQVKQAVPAASLDLIERVRAARSVHSGIGVGHTMEMPSSSDAKEATKKLIRFIYSEDGCRTFRNKAYGNLPLDYTIRENDKHNAFLDSVDKVLHTGQPTMVSESLQLNDVRSLSQMYFFNVTAWQHPGTFKAIMLSKGAITAQKIYEDEAAYMKSSWDKYMSFVF